jgi:hypothetical protein
LFDGTGHAAAKDLAAMIKYDHLARQKGIPVKNVVNFSIEGSKLETEKNGEIPKAIARKVTCTVAACNKMATAELYIPPKEKPIAKKEVKAFSDIFKSENDSLVKIEENFEPLQKGKKDILNMMGPKPEQHHHEFANWASKALPNSNWQTWAARHYKNKPEDFTPEIKQKLEHFGGSTHIPDIAQVRFDKHHDLHTGLQMLENAEKQYYDKIKNNKNIVKPTKKTTKFVQGVEKPNRHWFDLGKGSCRSEGKAMVHCGNVPTEVEGDRILSLRTEHKIGDKTYHEPHLTFIYNNGFLGEMKGRGNDKPAKHYHREIANLLKDPRIKGIIGGGFKPKSNFHFSDLSPELQQEVLKANPNLITSADINNDENVEKILSRKDELPEKYKDILVDIANKPNLDQKFHEQLINVDNPQVQEIIARKPDLDPKLYEKLVNNTNPMVKAAIARKPDLDPKYHEQLVNNTNPIVKAAIASNPNLDPKYHEQLVNDTDLWVKENIASNPNLDPKYHEQLVNNTNRRVKMTIASNPNLDPKYHEQLINDTDPIVKPAIASNPNLDPKYHEQLINDTDPIVKAAIAKNLNLDPKYHEKLVNDENWFVRQSIAQNPNLDPKHYEKLANDKDPHVRRAIAENSSYQKWKKEQSKKLAASEKYNMEYEILRKNDQSGIDRAWKPSISRLAGKNIVSLNHPQHGSITIVKHGDQFFVKHNGAAAGLRGNPGVFDNAKDALEHAQKYALAVSSGMVSPKKIHNMPSMQSAGLQRPAGKLAFKGSITSPMPTPKVKKSVAAPSQLVNQDALQKENLVSSIKKRANQAYKTFEKAEELLEHLKKKHPNISEPVLKALVKMFALKREEKLEKALEEIAKK